MNFFRLPKNSGIQWIVLRQQFIAALGTIFTVSFILFITSLVVTEMTPWQLDIEQFIGFAFYSFSYFFVIFLFLSLGIIIATFYSIFIGFPLGRELKKNLQMITDGADAFSRGRLDYRIKIEGYAEIEEISQQFNRMADRIEKQVNSLQRLVDENMRLANRTEHSIALDERRKLARELHDAVSQQLFAVSMTLAALPRLMEINPNKAKQQFTIAETMVRNAQQELRALIMHLRPVTLEGNSISDGVGLLLEELKQKHHLLKWEWEIDQSIKLSDGVENQLFRVIQEAISNMLRHSKATLFRLKLYNRQERVLLIMEDNGVGFNINDKKKGSYRLDSMKERIEDIGGRFDLISIPEKGTRVEIRVPIRFGKERLVDGKEN